jgi:hypothetical protein
MLTILIENAIIISTDIEKIEETIPEIITPSQEAATGGHGPRAASSIQKHKTIGIAPVIGMTSLTDIIK